MRFLETLVPETMGATPLTLDWRVLPFAVAVGVAAALIFGLAPALRGSRVAPQEGLRDGGRGTTGARSHWFRHSLIIVETALAVVLLTCGGLLLQTFQHLRNADLGIRSEKLLTFETPLFRYKDFDQPRRLHQRGVGKGPRDPWCHQRGIRSTGFRSRTPPTRPSIGWKVRTSRNDARRPGGADSKREP